MSADTASAPPQLRPLALGEILDVSIKLVARSFKAVVIVVLVVGLVVAAFDAVVTLSTTTYNSVSGRSAVSDAAAVAAVVVFLVLFLVAYVLATVACFGAIADAYMGRVPNWRTSLRFAARRGPATVWLGIIMAVLLTLAFIALIVPYFYFATAWSAAFPVMLLEGVGGFKALRRSQRLVKGLWWRTFATLAIAYIITFVLSLVAGGIVGAVIGAVAGDGSVLAVILEDLVNVAVQIVTLPFFAAVLIVLYVDLRVRKEGFDLQLMAEHMAHPDGPASYTPGPVPDAPPATGLEAPGEPPPDDPPPESSRHPAFGE